jgi:AcrR family transcriptional regulator
VNETYLSILKKAGETFIRLGVRSVTMDDLCRELGISKKTLYAHFEDKNALVLAVLKAHIGFMEKEATQVFNQESENPMAQFIQFTECMAPQMQSMHPALLHDLQKYHQDAWKCLENHKATFVFELIRQNLERGIKAGYYRDSINVPLVASFYTSLADELLGGKRFPNQPLTLSEIHREMIHYHLHGIASEKGFEYLKKTAQKYL